MSMWTFVVRPSGNDKPRSGGRGRGGCETESPSGKLSKTKKVFIP